MTTYGFLATNGNSQVLISSKTKNLHFLGKAKLYQTIKAIDTWGGIRRWVYRIESITTPVPFFTTPTADRYAIVRMNIAYGNTWDIEILRSGTSNKCPEVYVFTEANGQLKANTNWGMKVLNENSGISYDSRFRPLIIKGGTTVSSPYDPLLALPTGLSPKDCSTDANAAFAPNNTTSVNVYNTNLTKPLVSFQSVAQTMRQVQFSTYEESCVGFSLFGGCIGFGNRKTWNSYYWAFYRSGISVTQNGSTTSITAGWATVDYGCRSTYQSGSSFLGLINYNNRSSQAGIWPFTNTTINQDAVPVILTDGALYD
jgi:hypothetical protein